MYFQEHLHLLWYRPIHHHHHHHHHHEHENEHAHTHHDLNQKAAFMHVVADAVTSIFAIIALCAAKYLDWGFLDAVLGILGSILVAKWAIGLIKETGKTLLDAEMNHPVVEEIREVIAEFPQAEITDLHVWKVGKGKFSCILALVTDAELNADQVREALSIHDEIVHISVEINAL